MSEKKSYARETRPAVRTVTIRRSAIPLLTTAGVVASHGTRSAWGTTWRRRPIRGGR